MALQYDFVCAKDGCNHIELNVLCASGAIPIQPLEHCGQPMEICWNTILPGVEVFDAFVTRNIHPDGQPITIRGKGDYEFVAREYGVRHDYDDPGLEAHGSEVRKKTPKIGTVFDLGRR